ncbi:hypothetical protein A6R68_17322, partial [Neotoma lepida]
VRYDTLVTAQHIKVCWPPETTKCQTVESRHVRPCEGCRMNWNQNQAARESPDDTANTVQLELFCHIDNTGPLQCGLLHPHPPVGLPSKFKPGSAGQLTVHWSPYDYQVATASNTTLRVWDTWNRSQIHCLQSIYGQLRIILICYHHSHDQLVLIGSSDSSVFLFNKAISSEPFDQLVDNDDVIRPPHTPRAPC